MNIQTFSFANQSLQIIIKNNQAWFIANEVANLLGYRDAHNLTRILDDDEKDTHNMSTLGGNQDVSIINESGFYHAAFKSRKPEVKPFRKWVTSEVLPQIRQTGQYSGSLKTPTALPQENTTQTRKGLVAAVKQLAQTRRMDYCNAWHIVHHRFNIESVAQLSFEQIPQAIEYVHRLILDGEVLDKPKSELSAPSLQLNDELVLSIGRLLLHAQDMRLFVHRYLPAFECLGITNHGALWSYVHDTEPTFERVREFFLQQTPYQNHHLFSDDAGWVRRRVMATAKI